MSNKIDVEKGDTWGLLRSGNMVQYRGATWRLCGPDRGTGAWSRATGLGPDIGEQSVSERVAVELLKGWGYSITTPAAKDEAPAKTEPVICSSCRTFGCDDHVPDAKPEPTPGVFHLKCPQCCFVCKPDGGWVRRMCGCKHEDALVRVDGPLVLPERKPTPDVPVVDAVWVEINCGTNRRALCAYSDDASTLYYNGAEFGDGSARIVRLAPDAALAATVKRVEERVNDLTKIVHGLQDSMPGYDKDVTADEAFRRLDERLSKLEATTIRLDRPMEFGQGPATAICLAALRAVGVPDEEVNRE